MNIIVKHVCHVRDECDCEGPTTDVVVVLSVQDIEVTKAAFADAPCAIHGAGTVAILEEVGAPLRDQVSRAEMFATELGVFQSRETGRAYGRVAITYPGAHREFVIGALVAINPDGGYGQATALCRRARLFDFPDVFEGELIECAHAAGLLRAAGATTVIYQTHVVEK